MSTPTQLGLRPHNPFTFKTIGPPPCLLNKNTGKLVQKRVLGVMTTNPTELFKTVSMSVYDFSEISVDILIAIRSMFPQIWRSVGFGCYIII